ncbi:jg8368 [Pararge aegeria aegeria]|uniref:Jg8368 protein n=1 Tax=Pararge aegeria aegeria TaxID=348720 RepID=A0A8S4SMX7_9NEOP|nr:jg8368 [Pararge aegeria aegeria]
MTTLGRRVGHHRARLIAPASLLPDTDMCHLFSLANLKWLSRHLSFARASSVRRQSAPRAGNEQSVAVECAASNSSNINEPNALESGKISNEVSVIRKVEKLIIKISPEMRSTVKTITKPRKRNKLRKYLRNKGEAYESTAGRVREARRLRDNPCKVGKCQRRCYEISEDKRESIFRNFWSLDKQEKKQWIIRSCISVPINRLQAKSNESGKRRRSRSCEYYLHENDESRQVCLQFLLNTLDVTQTYLSYNLKKACMKMKVTPTYDLT